MNKKISIFQLSLLSTGGMLGCGWLFSPFYGYQTAGIGVLYSWLITAAITAIIGLSFAQVCSRLPVVGSIYRFMGVTHNRNLSSIFLIIGWLSYVVYLPLESQAVVQYLGFWLPFLITKVKDQVQLSWQGIELAAFIILIITAFNTLVITKVARANNLISIWKILIPLFVAFVMIFFYGHWENVLSQENKIHFNFENVLLAVTSSGLAFAFSGFQNGLILANNVKNPAKALPYSLFIPILVGLILYSSLSLIYLACLNGNSHLLMNTTAPLMGILALFSLNWLFTILFIDAMIAPLGTTNVYIAVTSRILYSVGKELKPNSLLTRFNKNGVPIVALWINALIGILFLFPFPTWKELVNFLSSIVVFSYLAGPLGLLILQKKKFSLTESFKLPFPRLIGFLGFMCCSWLIYWSGLANLGYLVIALLVIAIGCYFFNPQTNTFKNTWYLLFYIASLWLVSWLHARAVIAFPLDNLIVGCLGALFCYIFIENQLPAEQIQANILRLEKENAIIKTQLQH